MCQYIKKQNTCKPFIGKLGCHSLFIHDYKILNIYFVHNVLVEFKVEDFLERLVNGDLSESDSLNSGNEDETRSEIG